MKICFVGHSFHLTSKSHLFFLDVLKKLGTVEELYFSPDGDPNSLSEEEVFEKLLQSDSDRYVFWQSEGVAAQLAPLKNDARFVIVPMWDAASGRTSEFWGQFQGHLFIAFCRELHNRLQQVGLKSAYFQYFPEPVALDQRVSLDDEPSAFFWERRPSEAINSALVSQQCRAMNVRRLHVHAAPDFRSDRNIQEARLKILQSSGLVASVSRWLDTRAEFDALVADKSFYFAPRPLEGIGMSFLEAMARGQIVVAPNAPTMSDYIGHLASGVLYDAGQPLDLPRATKAQQRRLSDGAYARCLHGREIWLSDIDRLESLISGDGRRWIGTDFASRFIRDITRSANKRLRAPA